MKSMNFDEFAGGSLAEKTNIALKQVIENLLDVNTPYKDKRKITIEIGFTQNEERDDVSVAVTVKTKLASTSPTKTNMAIGKDLRTGEIMAEEYGKQIRGQLSFSDLNTPEMPEDCDPETGEKIATVTKMIPRAVGEK